MTTTNPTTCTHDHKTREGARWACGDCNSYIDPRTNQPVKPSPEEWG